jgi:hypothetical protein
VKPFLGSFQCLPGTIIGRILIFKNVETTLGGFDRDRHEHLFPVCHSSCSSETTGLDAFFYTLRLIGLGQVRREGGRISDRVPSCRLLANASKAALLRINSMDPFNCTICRIFRSAKRRVTVSREVPIIWAISS